jgi:hypothetical protein
MLCRRSRRQRSLRRRWASSFVEEAHSLLHRLPLILSGVFPPRARESVATAIGELEVDGVGQKPQSERRASVSMLFLSDYPGEDPPVAG